eukprot:gnl/TRDRNA2_/TRDRNA2_84747_c0_seq1.p1 gnl/TRDRNA2_/TRDRNA2_84747_c0~~gnl/TRDRNA2_/TRDRNA2_84747_c0_seq1.p1  ORF type:complete len:667 (-),score=106.99 gnl/TRDRNA2_/TRDRNA2_84747_c0_seq1:283-2232(-)
MSSVGDGIEALTPEVIRAIARQTAAVGGRRELQLEVKEQFLEEVQQGLGLVRSDFAGTSPPSSPSTPPPLVRSRRAGDRGRGAGGRAASRGPFGEYSSAAAGAPEEDASLPASPSASESALSARGRAAFRAHSAESLSAAVSGSTDTGPADFSTWLGNREAGQAVPAAGRKPWKRPATGTRRPVTARAVKVPVTKRQPAPMTRHQATAPSMPAAAAAAWERAAGAAESGAAAAAKERESTNRMHDVATLYEQRRLERKSVQLAMEEASMQAPAINAKGGPRQPRSRESICQRADTIVRSREQAREKARQEQRQLELQENTNRPSITAVAQALPRGVRDQQLWEQTRQERRRQLKEEQVQKQLEECSFQPRLSKGSRRRGQSARAITTSGTSDVGGATASSSSGIHERLHAEALRRSITLRSPGVLRFDHEGDERSMQASAGSIGRGGVALATSGRQTPVNGQQRPALSFEAFMSSISADGSAAKATPNASVQHQQSPPTSAVGEAGVVPFELFYEWAGLASPRGRSEPLSSAEAPRPALRALSPPPPCDEARAQATARYEAALGPLLRNTRQQDSREPAGTKFAPPPRTGWSSSPRANSAPPTGSWSAGMRSDSTTGLRVPSKRGGKATNVIEYTSEFADVIQVVQRSC